MALNSLVYLRGDTIADLDNAPHDTIVFIQEGTRQCAFWYDTGTSAWRRVAGKITSVDANTPLDMSSGILTFLTFIQEVNISAVPKRTGHFDITGQTGLTVSTPVIVRMAAGPYTGKGALADEAEMDHIMCAGLVLNSTTIRVYWVATGPVIGNFKFHYRLGS